MIHSPSAILAATFGAGPPVLFRPGLFYRLIAVVAAYRTVRRHVKGRIILAAIIALIAILIFLFFLLCHNNRFGEQKINRMVEDGMA